MRMAIACVLVGCGGARQQQPPPETKETATVPVPAPLDFPVERVDAGMSAPVSAAPRTIAIGPLPPVGYQEPEEGADTSPAPKWWCSVTTTGSPLEDSTCAKT